MKNSWPISIVITFGLFMVFILTLVAKTYSVNTELVSEDYYTQEIAYQDRINQMIQLEKDDAKINWVFSDQQLVLTFPQNQSLGDIKGTIQFYRPSDSSKDLSIPLELNEQGQQAFRKELFIKGLYKMKISWTSKGLKYYMEEDVYMP